MRRPRPKGPVDLLDHLVRVPALPGASPFAIARGRAYRAGGQERGLQVRHESRERLTRIRFARQGGAAEFLPGCDFLVTLRAALRVDGALRLWLAGRGVDEEPALCHAAVGRRHRLIAITRGERDHSRRISAAQDDLGFAPGRVHPGDPLHPRLGQRGEVGRISTGMPA
jgi:hypothetical protein